MPAPVTAAGSAVSAGRRSLLTSRPDPPLPLQSRGGGRRVPLGKLALSREQNPPRQLGLLIALKRRLRDTRIVTEGKASESRSPFLGEGQHVEPFLPHYPAASSEARLPAGSIAFTPAVNKMFGSALLEHTQDGASEGLHRRSEGLFSLQPGSGLQLPIAPRPAAPVLGGGALQR